MRFFFGFAWNTLFQRMSLYGISGEISDGTLVKSREKLRAKQLKKFREEILRKTGTFCLVAGWKY